MAKRFFMICRGACPQIREIMEIFLKAHFFASTACLVKLEKLERQEMTSRRASKGNGGKEKEQVAPWMESALATLSDVQLCFT
jgi:hypothetical protein